MTILCKLPPSHQAVPQVKNSVSWAWNLTPLLHVTRKHFAQFRETPTFPGMRPSREPERKLHVVSSKCHQGLSIVSRNRAISGNPAQSTAVTHPTLAGQRELLVAAFTTLLAWALAVLESGRSRALACGRWKLYLIIIIFFLCISLLFSAQSIILIFYNKLV